MIPLQDNGVSSLYDCTTRGDALVLGAGSKHATYLSRVASGGNNFRLLPARELVMSPSSLRIFPHVIRGRSTNILFSKKVMLCNNLVLRTLVYGTDILVLLLAE